VKPSRIVTLTIPSANMTETCGSLEPPVLCRGPALPAPRRCWQSLSPVPNSIPPHRRRQRSGLLHNQVPPTTSESITPIPSFASIYNSIVFIHPLQNSLGWPETPHRMLPCTLKREHCLLGDDLIKRLSLFPASLRHQEESMSGPSALSRTETNIHPTLCSSSPTGSPTRFSEGMLDAADGGLPLLCYSEDVDSPPHHLSRFEHILTNYEPILQTILAFLPTASVTALYQTSGHLRQFLGQYPLAWKTLSYRLPQPTTSNQTSPGINTGDQHEWQSKQFAFDLVLKRVVVPMASRLTSLDLCNTSVAGGLLITSVLDKRKDTLQHLSVRGCKNVSLKYHVVPFLHQCVTEMRHWGEVTNFALRSLYTYRCRHHRRRPYLPASLARRDSDSEPTHDLIELCHRLGIWTDTAWCPTPGPRCHRRKDYHGSRAGPGTMEVWVPFDRLWRSSNRVGPSDEHARKRPPVGKLWEEMECGNDGQPLGTGDSIMFPGEGKDTPTHQRMSHRMFVESIKCDGCGDAVQERCETCSIRMHCMGCRKTLCGSCAFNRPLKKRKPFSRRTTDSPTLPADEATSRARTIGQRKYMFWWAPTAVRSPNIMTDVPDDSDDETRLRHNPARPHQPPGPLKISMSWCCLEPMFSGGGGVAFVGPGLAGHGSERIRAVPLRQTRQYMDAEFVQMDDNILDESFQRFDDRVNSSIDILPYLQQKSLDLQTKTCPRCLCQSCYQSFRWKVECRGCKRSICKEHDFRALKVRKCGYRDLSDEREYVRNPPKHAREDLARTMDWPRELQIPEFRPMKVGESSNVDSGAEDERRPRQSDQADSQEWSDAGSLADGPASRDPSSTPRATPTPTPTSHADRSSSVASRADDITHGIANMDLAERAVYIASLRPSTRGRSLSVSELGGGGKGKGKAIELPVPKERMLLPCNGSHPVQWKGCGAYFCQGSRTAGDMRPRCYASGKDCSECGVYVCQVRPSLSHITFV
jgi:hypothetical protein